MGKPFDFPLGKNNTLWYNNGVKSSLFSTFSPGENNSMLIGGYSYGKADIYCTVIRNY